MRKFGPNSRLKLLGCEGNAVGGMHFSAKLWHAAQRFAFTGRDKYRPLRNDEYLLRIRIFDFAPGRIAAHIDISAVGIVGIKDQTWPTRNRLGGWELRLYGRTSRRRAFGFRWGISARSLR